MKRIRRIAIYLTSIEIWLVIPLVAMSVLLERVLPIAVGFAACFWIVRWLAFGRLSIPTPTDSGILLLVLMIPVTLWATSAPDITRVQVYRLLTGIALYYTIVNWAASRKQLSLLLTSLMLAGLLLSLIAPFTVTWLPGKVGFIPQSVYSRTTRLVADTINPSVLAGTLILLLPCALSTLLFEWRQLGFLRRMLIGITTVFMGATVLLTQSRGAWLGLTAALILLLYLYSRYALLLLFGLTIAAAITIRSMGVETVLNVLTTERTFGGVAGRVEIWQRALYMIQDFPFTGIGMGTFKQVADLMYPFFDPRLNIPHAHNVFLQVAVDLGIPGLIAWLAIGMSVMATSWRVYRNAISMPDRQMAGYGAGLLCSQVALLIHGFTDAVTWGMVRPAVVPWVLWGLSVACWKVYMPGISDRSSSEAHAAGSRHEPLAVS